MTEFIKSKKGICIIVAFMLSILLIVTAFYYRDRELTIEENNMAQLTKFHEEKKKSSNEIYNDKPKEVITEEEEGKFVLEVEKDKEDNILTNGDGQAIVKKDDSLVDIELPFDTSSIDESLETEIDKMALEIADAINVLDYRYIYEKLNPQYVEDFQITKDIIKARFEFDDLVEPTVTNIKQGYAKDRVIATIRFIDEGGWERIYDFTIYNDGTIADIALFEEQEINDVTERNGVEYTVKNKYVTRLGSIFTITIDNKSEELLNLKDIYGTAGKFLKYGHQILNQNTNLYKIYPGIETELILKIDNEENPNDIIFVNQKYDGTIEEFSIWENRH